MVALGFGGMGTPHFLHGSFTVTVFTNDIIMHFD
jgi:hypothetical protein